MTPDQFIKAGQRLYGKKVWKTRLARDLGINVATVHRMVKRPEIPGPYEVALKAMLQNKIQKDKLEKEARKLLPRKFRKRSAANVAKRQARKARPLFRVGRATAESAPVAQPADDRPDEAVDAEIKADPAVESSSG